MRRRLTYLRPKHASINEKPRTAAGLFYRESSDSPRLKAFCRVAPSVRFKVRAMLAARVVFNVRTSDDVHDRRFDFLGI
jgi:hypothetical protein